MTSLMNFKLVSALPLLGLFFIYLAQNGMEIRQHNKTVQSGPYHLLQHSFCEQTLFTSV